MKKVLTVKELINVLLDYNMDAYCYVNVNGIPIGISIPEIAWSSDDGAEGCSDKKSADSVYFDVSGSELSGC